MDGSHLLVFLFLLFQCFLSLGLFDFGWAHWLFVHFLHRLDGLEGELAQGYLLYLVRRELVLLLLVVLLLLGLLVAGIEFVPRIVSLLAVEEVFHHAGAVLLAQAAQIVAQLVRVVLPADEKLVLAREPSRVKFLNICEIDRRVVK